MSFRNRLLLFFAIIVVVPMIAVALVLFRITAESETGKVDARIDQALRTGFALYEQEEDRARVELDDVAGDPALQDALIAGSRGGIDRRMGELAADHRAIKSIALYDRRRREVARAGSRDTIAPNATTVTTPEGRRLGILAVSVTRAADYVRDLKAFTGVDARVVAGRTLVGSTLEEGGQLDPKSGEVEIAGREFRGRFAVLHESVGPALAVGVFEDTEALASDITENRILIGAILLAFLALALLSSLLVVRMLQAQIAQFLAGARRLGEGDFSARVPTEGHDEFAALGMEFNRMSEQLSGKVEEVERKRRELEETIRRVGEAFAAGLDRRGIVDLVVRTAVEACYATAGRGKAPGLDGKQRSHFGEEAPDIIAALERAEQEAVHIRSEDGRALIAAGELSGAGSAGEHRLAQAEVQGAHALAAPLPSGLSAVSESQLQGVLSIARRGSAFTRSERDLFFYLASQAAVSVENADLHETVQRQAITDELTGLFNIRRFHETLDGEIERSQRFKSPVGLVMVDLDDFKQINDAHGHQQGDVVLLEVARALRGVSRDIDEPVRYGGEEIAIVLPETDLAGAELLAERMRAAVEALEIERLDGQGVLKVTASFGVGSLPEVADGKEALIAAADTALYRAKRAGKNRVERAEPAAAPR